MRDAQACGSGSLCREPCRKLCRFILNFEHRTLNIQRRSGDLRLTSKILSSTAVHGSVHDGDRPSGISSHRALRSNFGPQKRHGFLTVCIRRSFLKGGGSQAETPGSLEVGAAADSPDDFLNWGAWLGVEGFFQAPQLVDFSGQGFGIFKAN